MNYERRGGLNPPRLLQDRGQMNGDRPLKTVEA